MAIVMSMGMVITHAMAVAVAMGVALGGRSPPWLALATSPPPENDILDWHYEKTKL